MKPCPLNLKRARIRAMGTDLALLRLLQLVSPGLPIGMYSYSQGLEGAVEEGLVNNAETANAWISGLLHQGITRVDIPVLLRLLEAWRRQDHWAVNHWSNFLTACRETSELRAEDRQTGQALAKLLDKLDLPDAKAWLRKPEATLATLYSLAAVNWGINPRDAAIGYAWSWLENQVLCAVKLVPLGQVAGQQLLQALAAQIPAQVDGAALMADDDIGGGAFGLALASSRHETQYSRLFRS